MRGVSGTKPWTVKLTYKSNLKNKREHFTHRVYSIWYEGWKKKRQSCLLSSLTTTLFHRVLWWGHPVLRLWAYTVMRTFSTMLQMGWILGESFLVLDRKPILQWGHVFCSCSSELLFWRCGFSHFFDFRALNQVPRRTLEDLLSRATKQGY